MGDLWTIKTVSLLRRSKTPIGIVGWAFAFVVLVGIVGLGSPIVTDGAITITSTGSGTGGIYIINDWVIVEWDNTGTGDGPQTISQVTADFTEFGGGGSIAASLFTGTSYEGKWRAQYQIVAGTIDDADNNVSITAYNGAPPTITTSSTNLAVDNIAPTVTGVTVDTDPIYDGDLTQQVTVTYSENMDQSDAERPTVQITGITTPKTDGPGGAATGTWNSSTEYKVTITLDDNNEEDSVLDIVVSDAKDAAGNTQVAKTENNPFSVDTLNPTVTSVTPANLSESEVGSVTVDITFSEPMNQANEVTVVVKGLSGGDIAVAYSSWTSSTVWRGTFTFADNDETVTNAYYAISGARDDAPSYNTMDALTSRGANNPLDVDTVQPTVTSVDDTDFLYVDRGTTVTVTATFSESMDQTTVPTVIDTGANDPNWTINNIGWTDATQLHFDYHVVDEHKDHLADVSFTISGARDDAPSYNTMDAHVESITVDTVKPTVTSVSVNTDPIYDGDLTQTITIDYHEAMNTSVKLTVAITGITTPKSDSTSGTWPTNTRYVVTITLDDDNEEDSVLDIVVGGAKDAAGNTQVAYTENNPFVVDTKNPTITSITSTTADGCYTVGATINVAVSFSEQVTLAGVGASLDVTLDTPADIVSIGAFGPATSASTTYTVGAGDNSCDLDSTAIVLSAGTLRDNAGNDAIVALPATTIADGSGIVVDTTLPKAVDDPNGNEDRSNGDAIEVRVDDYGRYRLMAREDTPVWINVRLNDTDLPCTVLLRIHDIPQQPKFGTAMFDDPAGNIRYTPDRGHRGPDHFTYRIRDACGNISPEGTVYVEVIRQMVMDDVYLTACTDTPTQFDVTATDLWIDPDDPDLISFTFDIVSAPAHGVVSGDLIDITYTLPGRTTKQMESASISLTYTPAAEFTGRDTITVRFADPFGGFSTAVVDIVVADCVVPADEVVPILVQQGDVLPMIVPLSFASIYEGAWDTVTLVAVVDGSTYAGALSASWDERVGRYILTLDSGLLPPGMYLLTIPLGNGETVSLTIEIGVAG